MLPVRAGCPAERLPVHTVRQELGAHDALGDQPGHDTLREARCLLRARVEVESRSTMVRKQSPMPER